MDPFNIKINIQNQAVVLTVLPTDQGYFKIIYYGAILVGIKQSPSKDWVLVTNKDLEAGDLPYYIHTNADDRLEIPLDDAFVAEVSQAIADEYKNSVQ